VIAGICVGIVVASLLGIACYWKLKNEKDRKDQMRAMTSLVEHEKSRQSSKVHPSLQCNGQIPCYDHAAYSSIEEDEPDVTKSALSQQVAALRPYTDTLHVMLAEVRQRNRQLTPGDNRSYVYRNVIQQLCRVLNILNSPDGQESIPEDGAALMCWTQKTLKAYLLTHAPVTWESAGSVTGTLQSTFKPDQRLVPKQHLTGDHYSNNYRYERYDGIDMNIKESYNDLSMIHLEDRFTDPIEV